jgi:hypothetical protein
LPPIAVAPAAEEFPAQPSPQDLPVIAPVIALPTDQASHATASLASLPIIAQVQPASSGVSAPIQQAAIAPPPPSAPAPPAETSLSRRVALPAIASIPAHRPHPAATVSFPETTEGVAFARDGGPWSGR